MTKEYDKQVGSKVTITHMGTEAYSSAMKDLPGCHIGVKEIKGVLIPYVIETGCLIEGMTSFATEAGVDRITSCQIECHCYLKEIS